MAEPAARRMTIDEFFAWHVVRSDALAQTAKISF
jgi:hypothetical protein